MDADHRAQGIAPGHHLAPQDTLRMRWLVLKPRGCSQQKLAVLESKGQGRPRAISPPFMVNNTLVAEYKWFGSPDSVWEIFPFDEVCRLFGMNVPFLEWLTEMFSVANERVIAGLETLASQITVRNPYPTLPALSPTPPSQVPHDVGDMVALKPGSLSRAKDSAVNQVFWLLRSKPTALFYVDSIGEPTWCRLQPCNHQGTPQRGGDPIDVQSSALNPDFSLSSELESSERSQRLLTFLLHQMDCTSDNHALSVSIVSPYLSHTQTPRDPGLAECLG